MVSVNVLYVFTSLNYKATQPVVLVVGYTIFADNNEKCERPPMNALCFFVASFQWHSPPEHDPWSVPPYTVSIKVATNSRFVLVNFFN